VVSICSPCAGHCGDCGVSTEDARRVAIAVLSQAVADAVKPPYKILCESEIDRIDAIDWIGRPKRSDWWIHAAGLDPQAVRSRLVARIGRV